MTETSIVNAKLYQFTVLPTFVLTTFFIDFSWIKKKIVIKLKVNFDLKIRKV